LSSRADRRGIALVPKEGLYRRIAIPRCARDDTPSSPVARRPSPAASRQPPAASRQPPVA